MAILELQQNHNHGFCIGTYFQLNTYV